MKTTTKFTIGDLIHYPRKEYFGIGIIVGRDHERDYVWFPKEQYTYMPTTNKVHLYYVVLGKDE